MKKLLLLSVAAIAMEAQAQTQAPLWLRDVSISPNGQEIAFCYMGDIYKVPTNGGRATQLTTQASYEANPIWSADGKQIAFSSDRHGNLDIFVMPANGGEAKRLTFNSAPEIPSTFTPDGKHVLFSAAIQDPAKSALFPYRALTELYQVPVAGGRTEQLLGTPAEYVNFNTDGTAFLYQDRKGVEDEWRKHHTSSITRNIWLYDTATKKHRNLTNREGEDRNPVWKKGSRSAYILSERNGGTMNVYEINIDAPAQAKAVTQFATHPVRFLSLADNDTLCYTWNGEIYTQQQGAQPKKVDISIVRDNTPQLSDLRFTSGARYATVSNDGKQVAFVVRGDVFVTSTEYETTRQITNTAQTEVAPSWSKDGRTLVYASERTGIWQLYTATMGRKEEPNFANATLINEKQLLPSETVERSFPKYSPDGKEIAFIEDRIKLMVLNVASGKVRQVTDGSKWFNTSGYFDFEWSPDGKWFTLIFTANRHDPYTDIGLVSAQGGEITNITQSGYINGSPRWALGGNAILFQTERYGMRSHASWGSQDDAVMVFLNQEAYDRYRLSKEDFELLKEFEKEQEATKAKAKTTDSKKKTNNKKADNKTEAKADTKKDIVVELDGLQDRIVRLTPNSSNLGDAILSKDGESLYYMSAFEKGYDLWKLSLRDRSTKRIQALDSRGGSLQMDKDGNIYLLGAQKMQKIDGKTDALKGISYRAEMRLDLAAERAAMFEHVYLQQKKRFYNLNMHGIDWDKMSADYRRFLPHISNNHDFAELLSEWLGELNVSHTGGRYSAPSGADATANLGVLYDWAFTGNGMKIEEIVKGGPFDHSRTKIAVGDVIEKIDGQDITHENTLSQLLNRKNGKKTLVSLYNPNTKQRWDEVVMPISNGKMNDLLYDRWVKQRAAEVEHLSGGRLGYVHIRSMADESFRTIYSDILGKYNHCEGIVIDTRFNGGGRMHEDIEVLFSGKKYFTQVVRDREACDMPSRRWNKPSIMLQCEANYSNAHGTPWVYKHRGIGKLVGMPVPGTMTSVSWETLQDPSLVFGIPVIGYQLPDGSYLENAQLEPDVRVENNPETVVLGEDTQLRRAVEELLKEL